MSNKDLIAKAAAWDYESAGYSETADLARALASALEAAEAELAKYADEPHRKRRHNWIGFVCSECGDRKSDLGTPPTCSGRKTSPIGQVAGDEFRPGLPSESLRNVCAAWTVTDLRDQQEAAIKFKGPLYRFAWWSDDMPDRVISSCNTWEIRYFRPNGKTWAEVEAMTKADAGKSSDNPAKTLGTS